MRTERGVSQEMKKAIFECTVRAKDVGDTATANLLNAMLPWDDRFTGPVLIPIMGKKPYSDLCKEAMDSKDETIKTLAGEDGLRQFREDPDAFCCRVVSDFYRNNMDTFIDERDQIDLVAAILQAFACGKYDNPEWKGAGFCLEWFSVLKPLLKPDVYATMIRELPEI